MAQRHEFSTRSSRRIYTGAIVSLRVDEVVMPGGQTAEREVVEHHGAVAVVAVDAHDRVVLVHQYRHPLGRRLWELPAGPARRPRGGPPRRGTPRTRRRDRTRGRRMGSPRRHRAVARIHRRSGPGLRRTRSHLGRPPRPCPRRGGPRGGIRPSRRGRRDGVARRDRQCHGGLGHPGVRRHLRHRGSVPPGPGRGMAGPADRVRPHSRRTVRT